MASLINASDALDGVMRDYMATLATKDEDIFKLYEDNKRMRGLVEDGLRASEEAEAQYRARGLLLESLQTELREKRCLIEAQDAESVALRDAFTTLRVILRRPSELDSTAQDIVKEVARVVERLKTISDGAEALRWQCTHVVQLCDDTVVAAEARVRAALVDHGLCGLQHLRKSAQVQADAMERAQVLEKDLAYVSVLREQELAEQEERHQLALAHAVLEATRITRQLEAVRGRHHEMEESLHQLQKEHTCHIAQCAMSFTEVDTVIDLLAQRCQEAEAGWASAVSTLTRTACTDTIQFRSAHASVISELETLKESCERDRDVIVRQRTQLSKAEGHKKEHLECAKQLARLQEQHDELRAKYQISLEREQRARQARTATVEDLRQQIAEREDAVERLHRREVVALSTASDAQSAVKALKREKDVLLKQVEELQSVTQQLEGCRRELTERDKHVESLHSVVQELKQSYEQRHAASLAELTSTVNRLEESHRALEVKMVEDALQSARSLADTTERLEVQHAASTAQYRQELHEWSTMVDGLRAQLTEREAECQRERAVRGVLEQQQVSETRLVRRLMDSMSESSLQEEGWRRQGEECVALRKRCEMLEQACRRSAATTAELREALHKERGVKAGRCASLAATTAGVLSGLSF